MAYRPDGTAAFVGLQRIGGTLGGRSGSFVVTTVGEFGGTEAIGTWAVVDGAGTGDLAGLHGRGGFRAPHGPAATFELDYDLD